MQESLSIRNLVTQIDKKFKYSIAVSDVTQRRGERKGLSSQSLKNHL